jgi:hypothetical protein
MSNYREFRDASRSRFTKLIAIGVVVGLLVVGVGVYLANSLARVEPGYVGVVRNGGWFANRDFQRLLYVGDGMTNVGWGSTVNSYPTSDIYDSVEPGAYGSNPSDGDTGSVDAYRVRTKDGKDTGVSGQFRYQINPDPKVLEAFDAKFGLRDYGLPGEEDRFRVYDGTDGLRAYIFNQLRQPQEAAMQTGFGGTNGAQLDPSLALLSVNSTDPAEIAKANAAVSEGTGSAGTFSTLSDTISAAAVTEFDKTLGTVDGKPYFVNVRFSLRGIAPSPDDLRRVDEIRGSISNLAKSNADAAANVAAANGAAQKALAEANGRKAAAAADADALVEKQRGYNSCTTCAEIDKTAAQGAAQRDANSGWKSAPQVYAPGNPAGPFVPLR